MHKYIQYLLWSRMKSARYLWCLRPKLHIWAACCSESQMEFHCVVRGVYLAIIANLSENRVAQLVYGHIMPPISVAYLVIGTTSKAYTHARRSDNGRLPHEKQPQHNSLCSFVRRDCTVLPVFLGKMSGTRYGPVGTRFL